MVSGYLQEQEAWEEYAVEHQEQAGISPTVFENVFDGFSTSARPVSEGIYRNLTFIFIF